MPPGSGEHKKGLMHRHNPKKEGLRHGHEPKKGGLRNGTTTKGGSLGAYLLITFTISCQHDQLVGVWFEKVGC